MVKYVELLIFTAAMIYAVRYIYKCTKIHMITLRALVLCVIVVIASSVGIATLFIQYC